LELVNHALQIRIAGAKTSGEPVSTALHHYLAIGQHFKLAGLARRNHGINAQPFFNQGHETRDLGFVAPSRRAGKYLNVHCVLQLLVLARFPINVISVNQWLVFVFPITRDRPVTRFFLISVFSVNQW